MFKRLLNGRSKSIIGGAFLLGGAGLVSRLLGLLRDRLLAGRFGAGEELDIYYAAFRIPDLIYSLLILGALSAAFIPVFTDVFTKDKKEAWKLVNNVLNFSVLFLLLIIVSLILSLNSLIALVAPGFSLEKKDLAISLTRLMLVSPLLLGISYVFSGVLQSFRKFLNYCFAPIFYNLGIIMGILIFVPLWGIYGLAYGVILGALLHFIIQLPGVIYSGFRYEWIWKFSHPGLRKIFRLMLPRIFGLAASQINLWVITAIASTLTVGSITIFNLANNLQYAPIGIFGISFATAAFPHLSSSFSRHKFKRFVEYFGSTVNQILFLITPLSILTFLLRAQIVRLILGTGRFGWVDTRLTAASLGLFSFSILAQSLNLLLTRTFYAMHNTKTPVIISAVSVIINILLSLYLVNLFANPSVLRDLAVNFLKVGDIKEVAVVGLPLAFSISSIINILLLFFALSLRIRIGNLGLDRIFTSCSKIFLAGLVMFPVSYFSLRLIAPLVDMRTFFGVFLQTGVALAISVFVYLSVSFFLGIPEFFMLKAGLKRKVLKSGLPLRTDGFQ